MSQQDTFVIKGQGDKKYLCFRTYWHLLSPAFWVQCAGWKFYYFQNSIQTNLFLAYFFFLKVSFFYFSFILKNTNFFFLSTHRCRYRNSIRFPHHWLCQKSITQTTTFLICHSWFRFIRSYGTFLSYDGLLVTLRILGSYSISTTNLIIKKLQQKNYY